MTPKKKTLLVVGGSLGARTINQSIENELENFISQNIQVIWQTGKGYAERADQAVKKVDSSLIITMPFITRMDLAYKLADLVVSRAGASSISELCLLGKPSILIPSPNVSEDHQTKNAQALEKVSAAILIPDNAAQQMLGQTILETMKNDEKLKILAHNTLKLALHKAAERIAEIVLDLAEKNRKHDPI